MDISKIFDNKQVKVLGGSGDITPGDWEFNMGVLWGAFGQINLATELKSVTLQTEESVKKLPEMAAWGLAGALLGPVGLFAGLIIGGNRKSVCAMCEMKDGSKFIAVMDSKVYQQLLAMSLSSSK